MRNQGSRAWQPWLWLAVVFVCGLVMGGLAGRAYERYQAWHFMDSIRQSQGQHLADMTLDRLRRALRLKPDQVEAIQPVLREAFALMHQMHEDMIPRGEAVMRQAMERIKPLLTPEQVKQLEADEHLLLLRPPPKDGPPPW